MRNEFSMSNNVWDLYKFYCMVDGYYVIIRDNQACKGLLHVVSPKAVMHRGCVGNRHLT